MVVKTLQVAFEEGMHQKLKHVAADTGETLANLIRQAVALLIEQHEKRQAEQHGEGR